MKSEFICISISDLMKYGGYFIGRGIVSGTAVWILEDRQNKILAYQVIEEGKQAFEGVSCLLEKQFLSEPAGRNPEIKAFLTGQYN
ncbi:hypothetical protein [Runella sp.]|uniref:hypothetical protein n=1 Tax=Runella sp. TaxID=1960881 RepID=UPI003D0A13BE